MTSSDKPLIAEPTDAERAIAESLVNHGWVMSITSQELLSGVIATALAAHRHALTELSPEIAGNLWRFALNAATIHLAKRHAETGEPSTIDEHDVFAASHFLAALRARWDRS